MMFLYPCPKRNGIYYLFGFGPKCSAESDSLAIAMTAWLQLAMQRMLTN